MESTCGRTEIVNLNYLLSFPKVLIAAHSPARDEINEAILNGESCGSIARRFGLSASTVHRHTKKNLREAVKEAQLRLFDRDVEQASVALKALDAAIDGFSGKANKVSINQLIL